MLDLDRILSGVAVTFWMWVGVQVLLAVIVAGGALWMLGELLRFMQGVGGGVV